MKKWLTRFLLIFLFALIPATPALAADTVLVIDDARLMTSAECNTLTELAETISTKYDFDVVLITVSDMEGESDADSYATKLYQEYDFGTGTNHSGLLFFVSMADRDYALIAHGYGNTAFTDYGKDVLLDQHVLPLLAENRYYEAFTEYFNTASDYLRLSRNGTPVDIVSSSEDDPNESLIKLGVVFLLPLVLAGIICLYWKAQMKTAVRASVADRYIPENGFVLTKQADNFLYRTETRRTIQQNSSGGRGGGGTSIGAGGFSGRSGKF